MFNSRILDLPLGLVCLYFFLSLLYSVIIESITAILKKRPSLLQEAISHLLGDGAVLKNLYEQPLFMGKRPGDEFFRIHVASFVPSRIQVEWPKSSFLYCAPQFLPVAAGRSEATSGGHKKYIFSTKHRSSRRNQQN
jgi:hypothetical protein